MNTPVDPSAPVAAVYEWWRAWQHKDRDTLARMAREDYVEYPGAGRRRNIGRQRILEVADRAFARVTIKDWSIDDIELREHGDVAVCAYYWTERFLRDGVESRLEGFATDVLVRSDGRWNYQSHHVSNLTE